MTRIDDVLGDIVEKDPARRRSLRRSSASPDGRSLSGAHHLGAYAVRRVPLERAGRHTPSFVTDRYGRAMVRVVGRRRASRTSRSAWSGNSCVARRRATPSSFPTCACISLEGPRARRRRDHAGVGVVVVEVQGGSVSSMRKDSGGPAAHASQPHPPGRPVPRRQVRVAYLRRGGPTWKARHSRVRWGHAIVVPYTDLADDFATTDCPLDDQRTADLDDLAGRLEDVCALQENSQRVPNADDVELILEILTGRSFPVYDLAVRPTNGRRLPTDSRRSRRPCCRSRGSSSVWRSAGEPAAGRRDPGPDPGQGSDPRQGERKAQRVALVCYSIGLVAVLQAAARGGAAPPPPAFVGSFEDLANEWGIDTASHDRNDADFWERDLAAQMAEIASGLV